MSRIPQVEAAFIVPAPEVTPIPACPPASAASATTPRFRHMQGYLDPAPGGIDAVHAWTHPGGKGAGIRLIDVEGDWQLDHEALVGRVSPTLSLLADPAANWDGAHQAFLQHGTSVLGQLVGVGIENVIRPCEDNGQIVTTGRDLARMFEDETPGLLHRHALNCILFGRSVSPPRQARIWMALDVTIYSALLAAWHIKWGHRAVDKPGNPPDYTRVYRERPITWEGRIAAAENRSPRFEVLFDDKLDRDGKETGERRCPKPFPSPGTPRHPAYPSGHSTYSAAASKVLAHFFLDQRDELANLADNIGMARLWGGVHWRQDHTAGQAIGEWVADQIIDQLCRDPVRPLPKEPPPRCTDAITPPTFETVETTKKYRADHDNGKCAKNQDTIPEPTQDVQEFQGQRGAF